MANGAVPSDCRCSSFLTPGCWDPSFFSVVDVSSATAGKVGRLVESSYVEGCCVEDEPAEDPRGRAEVGFDRIEAAITPVAAEKPSGREDRSKVSETLRKRPLSDDEAGRRLGTEEVSSARGEEPFWGTVGSRAGKGSTSLLDGDAGDAGDAGDVGDAGIVSCLTVCTGLVSSRLVRGG